jgi:hypothetical protein
MKHLAIALLAVATLALGACAKHDAAPSTYSSTHSTGYSK